MHDIADTRGLLALDAVVRTGSVARAALDLGWTQPTVHHHLTSLERLVGTRLVQKDTRGSRPTAAGALLARHAQEIIGLCRRMQEEVCEFGRRDRRTVHIGAFPTFGSRVLPEVQRLLSADPRWASAPGQGLDLEIVLDEQHELLERVRAARLDIALIMSAESDALDLGPSVHVEHLVSEPVWLCLPRRHRHAHAMTRSPLNLGLLREDRWAFSLDKEDHLDQKTRILCRQQGFEPAVGTRSEDFAAIVRMVAAGFAVAMIPDSARVITDDTVQIRLPLDALARDVRIVTRLEPGHPLRRGHRVSPMSGETPIGAVRAAIHHVVAKVARHARWHSAHPATGIGLQDPDRSWQVADTDIAGWTDP